MDRNGVKNHPKDEAIIKRSTGNLMCVQYQIIKKQT